MVRRIDDLRNANGKSLQRAAASRDPEADLLELLKGMWSWREELNLQPVVYKTTALPLSYASIARSFP